MNEGGQGGRDRGKSCSASREREKDRWTQTQLACTEEQQNLRPVINHSGLPLPSLRFTPYFLYTELETQSDKGRYVITCASLLFAQDIFRQKNWPYLSIQNYNIPLGIWFTSETLQKRFYFFRTRYSYFIRVIRTFSLHSKSKGFYNIISNPALHQEASKKESTCTNLFTLFPHASHSNTISKTQHHQRFLHRPSSLKNIKYTRRILAHRAKDDNKNNRWKGATMSSPARDP